MKMYSTVIVVLLACIGYYGSIFGSPYEHECPIFQCTGYKSCYSFDSFCSNEAAAVMSCFPADIANDIEKIITWCKGEHPLANPQCKYACPFKEMELSKRGKSFQNTSCELYTCPHLSGKAECYGYQDFCDRAEDKVKSCFPEKLNEERLRSWCEAGYEPKNDQCKSACIDRFPELASSSAPEFQYDSCPIHVCVTSGETICYGHQEYCDRSHQATVKSCFPEKNKEDQEKLLEWCQKDLEPVVNKQCNFACIDKFTRAKLYPPTTDDGDNIKADVALWIGVFLAVLALSTIVVCAVRKRRSLSQWCSSLRNSDQNDSETEESLGMVVPPSHSGTSSNQGPDEQQDNAKDNKQSDENNSNVKMRNPGPTADVEAADLEDMRSTGMDP